ncbi:aspartyl beta-hydroxylase [Shewanella sp. GutCb]|nr:aspartyl beta-hydroxylase [Shewanella sp. GutCb]
MISQWGIKLNYYKVQTSLPFKRLFLESFPNGLATDIARITHEHWHCHVNKRQYQGQWQAIALRCQQQHQQAHPLLQNFSIEADNENWVNLPALKNSPNVLALLNAITAPIRSVRLMKLAPNSSILPHCDSELGAQFGAARLHVPISGQLGVEFWLEGELVPMRTNELWYLDTNRPHWVDHRGSEPRINLVIDCLMSPWLQRQLDGSKTISPTVP